MEQMLWAYGLPKETFTVVMMFYENRKAMIRSPDRKTNLFGIDRGVLEEDISALYMFIIWFD